MSVVKIYIYINLIFLGNRDGLTVSALYSGSRGSSSRLGWVTMLCFSSGKREKKLEEGV